MCIKKLIPFVLALVLATEHVQSQSRVIADITKFKNDKGVCRACLFNSPQSFNGETGQPFRCVAVPVKNETARVVFDNVPPGTYAMFVFHDANSNNKIDKNFLGIPKEGYGASQNRLPFASAPNYDENKFVVDNKSTIKLQIKVRNL